MGFELTCKALAFFTNRLPPGGAAAALGTFSHAKVQRTALRVKALQGCFELKRLHGMSVRCPIGWPTVRKDSTQQAQYVIN